MLENCHPIGIHFPNASPYLPDGFVCWMLLGGAIVVVNLGLSPFPTTKDPPKGDKAFLKYPPYLFMGEIFPTVKRRTNP